MSMRCNSQLQLVHGFPSPPRTSSYPLSFRAREKFDFHGRRTPKKVNFNHGIHCQVKSAAALNSASQGEEEEEEGEEKKEVVEEEVQLLMAFQSCYNHIAILDTPKSRILLLDSTNNVHSILNKESKWTGSYWDEFAALPPVVPHGPIAIFGLGGGTAAHLMLDLWPSLQLEGWDIDEFLMSMAREFFGISELEKDNLDGGVLNIHIGDVFSSSVTIPGGYAGIIVDLFADGKVLPQLEEAATWLELYDKLMPYGRLMVNCGAGESESPVISPTIFQHNDSDGTWEWNAVIKALCKAFPGQVNWKKMPKKAGENYLAMTGPLPDLATWSDSVPPELSSSVHQWKTCDISDSLQGTHQQ